MAVLRYYTVLSRTYPVLVKSLVAVCRWALTVDAGI